MKSFLTKLLLVLSLVVNPVAVFASDFHGVGTKANLTMDETKCDLMEIPRDLGQSTLHDSENCEMPCCEDSECLMQGICIVQHNSNFVIQTPLRFSHPIEHHEHDAFIAVVPERKLSPENPPPIQA